MNLESVIQSIVNQKEKKTNINAYIFHVSKVLLKILHARLQHYMNQELPDIQAGFRKGRGTRDQIVNIHWVKEKTRELQKNIYFCFIDYTKAFDCVDHNKLWKALTEMGIPDHLTCLLRKLYAGQEATVRTLHGTTHWYRIEKGERQGCLLSLCLFNLYAKDFPGGSDGKASVYNAGDLGSSPRLGRSPGEGNGNPLQ